jgi:hypothetical protein
MRRSVVHVVDYLLLMVEEAEQPLEVVLLLRLGELRRATSTGRPHEPSMSPTRYTFAVVPGSASAWRATRQPSSRAQASRWTGGSPLVPSPPEPVTSCPPAPVALSLLGRDGLPRMPRSSGKPHGVPVGQYLTGPRGNVRLDEVDRARHMLLLVVPEDAFTAVSVCPCGCQKLCTPYATC